MFFSTLMKNKLDMGMCDIVKPALVGSRLKVWPLVAGSTALASSSSCSTLSCTRVSHLASTRCRASADRRRPLDARVLSASSHRRSAIRLDFSMYARILLMSPVRRVVPERSVSSCLASGSCFSRRSRILRRRTVPIMVWYCFAVSPNLTGRMRWPLAPQLSTITSPSTMTVNVTMFTRPGSASSRTLVTVASLGRLGASPAAGRGFFSSSSVGGGFSPGRVHLRKCRCMAVPSVSTVPVK